MKETIYIKLLGEGTVVYRPVPAVKLNNNVFKLKGNDIYDSDNEEWEFSPEDIVKVEKKKLSGELVFVAIEKK